MKSLRMLILLAVPTLVFGSSLTVNAALIGHWTFQLGSPLKDQAGNFPDLVLKGDAQTVNGELDTNVAGPGGIDWAITGSANGGYIGPAITNKTMVSWVTIESLPGNASNPAAGSGLTLDRESGDQFDGIVLGERQNQRWMNGSSGFNRSGTDFSPGFQETTTGTKIQMAITYEYSGANIIVTGYHDGTLIGSSTYGIQSSWATGDAEVIFGLRHTSGKSVVGPGGDFLARIDEARIYNTVLTQAEIQALVPLPEPSMGILCLIGLMGLARFARKRTC